MLRTVRLAVGQVRLQSVADCAFGRGASKAA